MRIWFFKVFRRRRRSLHDRKVMRADMKHLAFAPGRREKSLILMRENPLIFIEAKGDKDLW